MDRSLVERLRREIADEAGQSAATFQTMRDVRLSRLIRFHYENPRNAAYRDFLRAHGISSAAHLPTTATGLVDLPIVEKDLLRGGDYANHPTIAEHDVRFVVSTSGSTGLPLRIPHSHAFERRVFGELFARMYLMLGYERLLDGPAYFVGHYTSTLKSTGTYAAFTMLCDLWGSSATMGNTADAFAAHADVLLHRGVRSSCSAPGFYLAALANAGGKGIDLSAAPLELIVAGGAPISAENHERLVRGFGLRNLRLGYVNSELGWMGVQMEERGSYVIFADEYILEVLDADGRHVAPGEHGRVAVTALACDAAPLIRYTCGDTARYLGHSAAYPNFPLIDEISRDLMAIIGDGKVSYDDLAQMPRTMAALGAPVAAFQLAKRLAPDGRDQVHLRVELVDPAQDPQHIERAAITALRCHPHLDFHLSDGELPAPIIETHLPGHLTTGRFKVPLYVDETTAPMATVRQPRRTHARD
jgi:phenylacetate-coenzyme A ligase PaaK-like adenylate-forming protein